MSEEALLMGPVMKVPKSIYSLFVGREGCLRLLQRDVSEGSVCWCQQEMVVEPFQIRMGDL